MVSLIYVARYISGSSGVFNWMVRHGMHILNETFSVNDLFDFQILQICLIYKANLTSDQIRHANHPSSDIFNLEHQMHTFSKTFSSVDDINSQWRCANAGRVVNRKICKLDCYANFLTITVGKGCGLKNWYFPRRLKLKLLKVNIGRKLVIYQLLTEKI